MKTSLIFLTNDRVDFYWPDRAGILSLDLKNFIQDQEVVKEEELIKNIGLFINANKLTTIPVTILLASTVFFEKDFSDAHINQFELQTKEYLASIPFERVESKVFAIDKGFKVVATNKDLYSTIKTAFEKSGFKVVAVIPLIGNAEAITNLTPETATAIIKNFDSIKDHNISNDEKEAKEDHRENNNNNNGKKNSKLPVLGGVFGLLVLVLVFMAYNSFKTPTKVSTQAKSSAVLTPLPISPTRLGSPSAILKKEDVKIQIVAEQKQAQTIQTELAKAGFSNTQIATQSGIQNTKTLVLFSQRVDLNNRNLIGDILKKIFTVAPSVQESRDSLFDVVITTGQ